MMMMKQEHMLLLVILLVLVMQQTSHPQKGFVYDTIEGASLGGGTVALAAELGAPLGPVGIAAGAAVGVALKHFDL